MIKIIRNSGQVEIISPHGRTYLYTEDAGSRLLSSIHTAIAKKKFWDDADHLASLIYHEMIGEEPDPDKFAIGSEYFLDVNLFVSIDVSKQIINFDSYTDLNDKFSMTFDEFLHNFFRSAKL